MGLSPVAYRLPLFAYIIPVYRGTLNSKTKNKLRLNFCIFCLKRQKRFSVRS